MTIHSDSLPGFLPKPKTTASDAPNDLSGDAPSETFHDVPTQTQAANTTTGGGSTLEPVVVWEAANYMEAQIVKGRLESEDIPALIRGEALGRIYGLTSGSLAATDVLVPAPLADKAREILTTEVEWADFDEIEDEIEDEIKEEID